MAGSSQQGSELRVEVGVPTLSGALGAYDDALQA